MKLQVKINSAAQVIEESGFETTGCSSAIADSSLATEWVKGRTSRKRWPSRTRISSVSSAFPLATLLNVRRYSGIWGEVPPGGYPSKASGSLGGRALNPSKALSRFTG
jgi:hypothetical protein